MKRGVFLQAIISSPGGRRMLGSGSRHGPSAILAALYLRWKWKWNGDSPVADGCSRAYASGARRENQTDQGPSADAGSLRAMQNRNGNRFVRPGSDSGGCRDGVDGATDEERIRIIGAGSGEADHREGGCASKLDRETLPTPDPARFGRATSFLCVLREADVARLCWHDVDQSCCSCCLRDDRSRCPLSVGNSGCCSWGHGPVGDSMDRPDPIATEICRLCKVAMLQMRVWERRWAKNDIDDSYLLSKRRKNSRLGWLRIPQP